MDIDYGALFGIDEGGKEQEIADPATDETTQAQGAEEQEAADPSEEETQDTSADTRIASAVSTNTKRR